MLASKSEDVSQSFDKFICLRCESTISLAADGKQAKPKQ
jgi:ribosomal protein L40E